MWRFGAAAVLAASVSFAVCQGGFGGGGFGGGGGAAGVQGGQGGVAGDLGEGSETVATHILTPGDKTDWPVDLKAGEALIIKVRSDVFDPAVEVTDEEGKVTIAKNDDVAPGQQNAQVLAYFEKAGKYRIRVLNYRSSAGGQYELRTRKIGSVNAAVGTDLELPKYTEDGPRFVRYQLKKGVAYCFGAFDGGFVGNPVIEPNGNTIQLEIGAILRPAADGQYFVRAIAPAYPEDGKKPRALCLELTPKQADMKNPPKASESPRLPYELWQVTLDAGSLVRLSLPAKEGSLQTLEVRKKDPKLDHDPVWEVLVDAPKNSNDRYVLAKDSIELLMVVVTRGGQKSYQVSLTNGCSEWDGVTPLQADLPVGGTHFYRMSAKRADYIYLLAQAQAFDLKSTLYYDDGNRYVEVDDTNDSLNAITNAVIPQSGTYYFAITSYGQGGGGAYSLKGQRAQPDILTLGEPKEVKFDSPVSGTLEFEAKAGQELLLEVTRGSVSQIWQPDGENLVRQTVSLEGRQLVYLRIGQSGKHRLLLVHSEKPVNVVLKAVPK